MHSVQNCDSYANVPSSQTYASHEEVYNLSTPFLRNFLRDFDRTQYERNLLPFPALHVKEATK
jgi:hypothetical protein